jgi:capsular polysaccharide biosynthesis protein
MDYRQLMRAVARWWWLGALPVLVVVAYVGVTYTPPTPTYQVVFRFTAGTEAAIDLSPDYDRYYAWLTSEYIANGLADYAMTARFAEGVADRLARSDLDLAPQAIQGSIVTDNVQSVFVVYLTWFDADQLRALADAVIEELLAAGPVAFPQMAGLGPVARLADPPAPVALSPTLRARLLGPAVRVLLGAFVGAGLIFLAHLLDPAIRDAEALDALDLPVLSTIPRLKRR